MPVHVRDRACQLGSTSLLAMLCLVTACRSTGGRAEAWLPAGPTQEFVVPTEMCSDFFFVPLTLAPREGAPADAEGRTLRLLYDTGAGATVLDPDALERVTGQRIETGRRVSIRDLDAGPVHWSTLPARTAELDHLGHALNQPFDGILGFGAFEDVLVTLDYPAQQMRAAHGALPAPDGRTVLSYGGDGRPFVRLEAGGRERNVLIDSGSGGALALDETRGMTWAAVPIPLSASMRIDRLVLKSVGRLDDDVALGPLVFDDPIVSLTSGTQLIGTKLLRHLVMTFDQANERVALRAAPDVVAQPVRLESVRGVGASFHPRAGGLLEVAHVLAGSPADRAGLQLGDLIESFDGIPLADLGCLRERMRDATAVLWVLGVRRAGESLTLPMAIEVLLP